MVLAVMNWACNPWPSIVHSVNCQFGVVAISGVESMLDRELACVARHPTTPLAP